MFTLSQYKANYWHVIRSGRIVHYINRGVDGDYQNYLDRRNDGSYTIFFRTGWDGWTTKYASPLDILNAINAAHTEEIAA